MESASESPFAFIADKLRSIPLVSAGMSRDERAKRQKQILLTTNDVSTAAASMRAQAHTSQPVLSGANQASKNRPGKRDASPLQQRLGERIKNQSEILFKRNGSTASVANIVRPRTTNAPKTSTTRRPNAAQTTARKQSRPAAITTTAKPANAATTTRNRASASSDGKNSTRDIDMKSNASLPQVEPITSYRATSLRALAATTTQGGGDDDNNNGGGEREPRLHSENTTRPSVEQPPSASPQTVQTTVSSTNAMHLTRATQAQLVSTVPVNQRRQQQQVFNLGAPGLPRSGTNRFVNNRNQHDGDPLRGAGENWTLFSRPDGRFSLFETLVLISNILIVSTVIFVILFNIIKAMRRKRSKWSSEQQQQQQQQRQPKPVPVPMGGAVQDLESHGPSMSKLGSGDATSQSRLSTISSGVQSRASTGANLANTTEKQANQVVVSMSDDCTQANIRNEQASEAVSKQDERASKGRNGTNEREPVATVGPIDCGEIKQQNATTNRMNNKAMAIVQPSAESKQVQPMIKQGEPIKETPKDSTGGQLGPLVLSSSSATARPISRTVSDLSGGKSMTKANYKDDPRLTVDDSTPVSEPDRVAALEEFFVNGKSDKLSKNQTTKPEQQQQPRPADSLESIELPADLVQASGGVVGGKRSEAKPAPDELPIGPSPNLLLGEKANAEQAKQLAAGAAEKEPSGQVSVALSPDQRPENPMGRDQSPVVAERAATDDTDTGKTVVEQAKKVQRKKEPNKVNEQNERPNELQYKTNDTNKRPQPSTEIKNHQMVVNKLDKRKTNLEIVDLRDESVTGKMRAGNDAAANNSSQQQQQQQLDGWISMDGVAVVHAAPPLVASNQAPGSSASNSSQSQTAAQGQAPMSPSEIIESRFHVHYASGSAKRRRSALVGGAGGGHNEVTSSSSSSRPNNQESLDSKQEEHVFNNIENELEQDNKMRNRKYFVYIVHDGHFTAKKECIARIELPPKRRITLAELRQLIASSQDISLSSLRKNRFKFVTETYRLLNENEDAAVLHQVYPTQGVFLKLNVTDNQDSAPHHPYKVSRPGGASRLVSGPAGGASGSGMANASASGGTNSLAQATIASRRRANARTGGRKLNTTSGQDGNMLPAIEVNLVQGARQSRPAGANTTFRRSKSSVHVGRRATSGPTTTRQTSTMRKGASHSSLNKNYSNEPESLPPIGKSQKRLVTASKQRTVNSKALGEAAADLGANVLSGAKKLFNFSKK